MGYVYGNEGGGLLGANTNYREELINCEKQFKQKSEELDRCRKELSFMAEQLDEVLKMRSLEQMLLKDILRKCDEA